MAYDTATGDVVLFGGWGTSGLLANTWTWSGSSWTERSPATSPSARYDAAMAFDASTGQMLLFGGDDCTYTNCRTADTWTWNGATWNELSPATSPPPTTDASMVYDRSTGDVMLVDLDGTWIWNGSTWAQVTSQLTGPAVQSRLFAMTRGEASVR